MQAFTEVHGIIAPLDRANVDTDAIIPKQFLKSIKRTGFEEGLFFDWRLKSDGSRDPDFSLNQPRFQDAKLLVARNNFGCGSSREHAVWAVIQGGFTVVIAPWRQDGDATVPGFADIFKNNSSKNGLLTIELSEPDVESIFQAIENHDGLEAAVDLASQTLTVLTPEEMSFTFDTDPAVKKNMLSGLDDIGLTLEHESTISTFEADHDAQVTWA